MKKKISAIIIDDMPLAIANLQAELEENHQEINIVSTANGVLEGAKKIKQLKPDLIFLDVHMGDGDGFDLLDIIESQNIAVIFTTASKEHAIKAFQFAAVDYLLKPVDSVLLKQAIEKVEKLKDNLTDSKGEKLSDRLTLNTQEEIRVVLKKDIIRLESMGNYTTFFISDDSKVLVTKTLKEFDKKLPSFIRVHQSHLVNVQHIKSYIKTEGGYLELKNGSRVPVSFRKKAFVIDALSNKK